MCAIAHICKVCPAVPMSLGVASCALALARVRAQGLVRIGSCKLCLGYVILVRVGSRKFGYVTRLL